MYVPSRLFFVKGTGVHKDYLQSFEWALRNAGIADQNIATVSSIWPAAAKKISLEDGKAELQPGQITFVVLARNSTNEANRLIAASIGYAKPEGNSKHGYLSEHHPYGETDEKAGDYAEVLATDMLFTTEGHYPSEISLRTNDENLASRLAERNFKVGPAEPKDPKKYVKIYDLNDMYLETILTGNNTQSAEGARDGRWTTVIAAAVLLP